MPISLLIGKVHQFIVEPLLLLLFGVAFVIFVWGIVEFIQNSESDDGRETGKRNMIWGIVGMVIMLSVFGIINIIAGTLGVEGVQTKDEQKFQSDTEKKFKFLQKIGID